MSKKARERQMICAALRAYAVQAGGEYSAAIHDLNAELEAMPDGLPLARAQLQARLDTVVAEQSAVSDVALTLAGRIEKLTGTSNGVARNRRGPVIAAVVTLLEKKKKAMSVSEIAKATGRTAPSIKRALLSAGKMMLVASISDDFGSMLYTAVPSGESLSGESLSA